MVHSEPVVLHHLGLLYFYFVLSIALSNLRDGAPARDFWDNEGRPNAIFIFTMTPREGANTKYWGLIIFRIGIHKVVRPREYAFICFFGVE